MGLRMILTERQKDILSLFLTNQTVTVKEIEDRINISRRTVYREFNDLRDILKAQNIELVNEKHQYFLAGKKEDLAKLDSLLQKTPKQMSMGVEERENALAVLLLLADAPQKIITFALDLNVSEATVQNDLANVKKSLAKYKIKLVRTPGVGVKIETDEYQRRQILVGILLNEINDYEFFHYLNHDQTQNSNFFLSLFSRNDLVQTRDWLRQVVFNEINLDSDHQIIELILTFLVTLKRVAAGYKIETNLKASPGSLKYEGLVYKVLALVTAKEKLKIGQADIIYLANKLMACDNTHVNLHYDNDSDLETSIKVKRLVNNVSEKIHWNFQKNPNFVSRLSKHIIGLLQHRVTPLPNTNIETLSGLSHRFNNLYQAIQSAWKEDFSDEVITKSEMQLLLLYFANEYTSTKRKQNLNALVICENGIGTSAILKSRLRQELPEIKQIKISKVADLADLNLQDYDVILSTLELRGFSRKYQLVSPLLLDDEISRIKNYLKDYEEKFPLASPSVVKGKAQNKHTAQQLSAISIGTLFCNELVNSIKVQKLVNNSSDLIAVIQECLAHNKEMVRQQAPIAKKILQRINLAPVGIPNSNLALLHTSSSEVKRCSFMVFDLDNEISLEAMDHTKIEVKRVLLMLGPSELSEAEQSVMSMISSMIIMNDTNFKLFTKGTQEEIKNAIASQYLQDLKAEL